jgi:hypothetical protein
MCIYYGDLPDLTYEGEDHIFSAAIGGVAKLPQGFVSDQFNHDMSKIELDLFRDGLPGLSRIIYGPGKRGSLSPLKQTKSKISLMSGGKEGRVYSLGFVMTGIAYEIPQVHLTLDPPHIAFSYDPNFTAGVSGEVLDSFRHDCFNMSEMQCRTIIDNNLKDGDIVLGIAKNVEQRYSCFLAKSGETHFGYHQENMRRVGELLQAHQPPIPDSYLPTFHSQLKINGDQLRVFGKIAFNALAHLTSEEFAQRAEFDGVRNWITNGGGWMAKYDTGIINYFQLSPVKFPDKAHYVMLNGDGKNLYASIVLYGNIGVSMLLKDQLTERFALDGLACDWQNKKEISLFEVIANSVTRDEFTSTL